MFEAVSLVVLQAEDEPVERVEEGVSGGVAQEAGVARSRVCLHCGPGCLSLQEEEEVVRGDLVVLHALEQAPVVVLQIH